MKIAIASDHAGFELKEALKKLLEKHEIIDFGTTSPDSMDYPDTGFEAAEAVGNGDCELGIVICGSGVGMSIVANKVDGVRAALCYNPECAKLSRQHNNANVLALPARFISTEEAEEIVKTWLTTEFEGGRHNRRVNKIREYEKRS
jgi:ribose 5-phosphate isomerase B